MAECGLYSESRKSFDLGREITSGMKNATKFVWESDFWSGRYKRCRSFTCLEISRLRDWRKFLFGSRWLHVEHILPTVRLNKKIVQATQLQSKSVTGFCRRKCPIGFRGEGKRGFMVGFLGMALGGGFLRTFTERPGAVGKMLITGIGCS